MVKKTEVEFDDQVYKQGLKSIVEELLRKKQDQQYKSVFEPLVTIRPELEEVFNNKLKYLSR